MPRFDRANWEEEPTSIDDSQVLYKCSCCEPCYPLELSTRPGVTDRLCDWCHDHCGTMCTRYNNEQISRIYTVPAMSYRLWEWFNFTPIPSEEEQNKSWYSWKTIQDAERGQLMPDRLNDALANSLPPRHRLRCMTCGCTITGNSALGTRLRMKFHRRSHRK